jgi:hypothetical protein
MFAAQLVKVLRTYLDAEHGRALDSFASLATSFEELFANRRIARILEAGDSPATLVFRGEKLVTVRATERQQTFRFDTSTAPVSSEIMVGDIVELRGGEFEFRTS